MPFSDESNTNRAILLNYTPVDTFRLTGYSGWEEKDLVVLLQKQKSIKHFSLIFTEKKKIKLNQWIYADTSDVLQYCYAKIKYTLPGELCRFLLQAAQMNILIRYEDGSIRKYRAVLPVMETGFLINKKVADTFDAYQFFKQHGKQNERIISFCFTTDNTYLFKNDIPIELKTYQIE
jgi:hypothetical protein